jgi:hypothetical protein
MANKKWTSKEISQFLNSETKELPLIPEFFDFLYSDEGDNDPLKILLERENIGDLVIEVITINGKKTVIFHPSN